MYCKFVFATLLFVALTFVAAGADSAPQKLTIALPPVEKCVDCQPGEEYSTCGTCEPTCNGVQLACTRECKVGCFCTKGLVRNTATGKCVPKLKCQSKYPPIYVDPITDPILIAQPMQ